MAFDLATAKPASSSGFDLSTATSVDSGAPLKAEVKAPEATLGREAGIASRAALTGLEQGFTAPVRAVGEAVSGAAGLLGFPNAAQKISQAVGMQNPGAGAYVANKADLPVPQTSAERVMSAGVQGTGAAIGSMGLGSVPGMAQRAPELASNLTARPIAQAASGFTGGTSSQGASEMGVGPTGQAIAGVAGGLIPFGFKGKTYEVPRPQDAIKAKTLEDAKSSGFVVAPSDVNPSFPNTVLESIPGKGKVATALAEKNQEIRNNLIRQDLGLIENEPISTSALDKVRRDAYKDYESVIKADYGDGKSKIGLMLKDYPQLGIVSTPEFKDRLNQIQARFTGLSGEFPSSVDAKSINSVLKDFQKNSFTPEGSLGIVKRLRNQSSVNIRSDSYKNQELGRFQYEVAQSMEDLIGQNLTRIGKPELLDAFQKARQQIAKTYDVEYALNASTGDISGARLARRLASGKPLSGGMETAAKFTQAFPTANKDVARIGAQPTFNAWDFLVAGGAAAAGHPGLAAAELVGRGGIPRLLTSDAYQSRFANLPKVPQSSVSVQGITPAMLNQIMQQDQRNNQPPPPQ